ncbi:MAG: single-stranded-DNA-specific exonuclease RecJ, partial [Clostridia bacterium]|nr:single-stranded-DNA-specific exonuclease RecJ [Clostridia bacterium]
MKKEKQWLLKSQPQGNEDFTISKIASALGINPIIARLLYTRGCKSVDEARSFILMESEMLENPLRMTDMEKAIRRVERAVLSKEKITIYGDYDVDGVTSVCTLYLYLKSKGADISYYIPNRAGEGYGVSNFAIDALAEGGTRLIVTVDTGITANSEVEYAKTVGVDFVITDHHECHGDIPSACAVINPHRPDCPYPFKELAGVGVVFKFICAYEEVTSGISRIEAARRIFAEYADLVAIGTIADVMPIKSENRIIVSYGLKMIENSTRLGLLSLIEASQTKGDGQRIVKKPKITSGYIGYTLAPRINAAGRIKTASMAVELFLAKDKATADGIAEALCEANRERQAEENKIMQEANQKIADGKFEDCPVIVLDADDWHHGVIGIVSSRITEKYSRPSILVSFEGNGDGAPSDDDAGKGSGRSIKGMNLVDALCYCADLLIKFGGHELAAGLSVSRANLPKFREKINEYARLNLKDEDMLPTVEADTEIRFSDVNINLADGLRILEPYGVDNPVPVFIIRGVYVNEIIAVGGGKHTKIILSDGSHTAAAIYFSATAEELNVHVGECVDVLFNLDINEWNGRKSVQMILRDIKHSKSETDELTRQKARVEEIRLGARFTKDEDVLPSREDFAVVYKYLLGLQRSGVKTAAHKDICTKLSTDVTRKINYIKLKIIVMVMRELNIISIDEVR